MLAAILIIIVISLTIGVISQLIAATTVSDELLSFSKKMEQTWIYMLLTTVIALLYIGSGYLWVKYSSVCKLSS